MHQFTIPIKDHVISELLARLSTIVKSKGSNSPEVHDFIGKYSETTFVDSKSGLMHTFEELAPGLVQLWGGLENQSRDDSWKSGNSEDSFYQKDNSEPADWWK